MPHEMNGRFSSLSCVFACCLWPGAFLEKGSRIALRQIRYLNVSSDRSWGALIFFLFLVPLHMADWIWNGWKEAELNHPHNRSDLLFFLLAKLILRSCLKKGILIWSRLVPPTVKRNRNPRKMHRLAAASNGTRTSGLLFTLVSFRRETVLSNGNFSLAQTFAQPSCLPQSRMLPLVQASQGVCWRVPDGFPRQRGQVSVAQGLDVNQDPFQREQGCSHLCQVSLLNFKTVYNSNTFARSY